MKIPKYSKIPALEPQKWVCGFGKCRRKALYFRRSEDDLGITTLSGRCEECGMREINRLKLKVAK
jgi:hypothetical protein